MTLRRFGDRRDHLRARARHQMRVLTTISCKWTHRSTAAAPADPTFNLHAQVIGINTAIYSPSGGSVGIGFAVPSNIAKQVVRKVAHSWFFHIVRQPGAGWTPLCWRHCALGGVRGGLGLFEELIRLGCF